MKLVACSDLHVNAHKVGSANGGADRLADGVSALRQTLDVARTHACPWLFIGDLKMPRSVWPVDALNAVLAALDDYDDVEKFAVPGNHDAVFGERGSGLRPIAQRGSVRVLDKPEVVRLKYDGARQAGLPDVYLAAWPYGRRRADELPAFLDRAAKLRTEGKIVLLAAHLTLAGALMGPTDVAPPGVGGASPEAFRLGDACDVAVFGDVHKGQVLTADLRRVWRPYADLLEAGGYLPPVGLEKGRKRASPARQRGSGGPPEGYFRLREPGPWRGEAFYPGSSYQQSWGELNEWPKGCLLLDLATGAVDLAPVKAPRFRAVECASLIDLEQLAKQTPSDWADDVVRLTIPAQLFADAGRLVEKLRVASKARLLQVAVRRDAPKDAPAPALHAGMTTEVLVARYVDARPPDADLSRDVVLKALAELAKDPEDDGRA